MNVDNVKEAIQLLAEFSPRKLQASVLDVDCSGRYAFFAGSRQLAVIDLGVPYEFSYFLDVASASAVAAFEHKPPTVPSYLQCHPRDSSRLALIRRNVCEVYSWSENESRLTPLMTLQGYVRPISCVDWCPAQPSLLATSSSEQFRSISIWDLRDSAKLVKNIELFGSTNVIRWNPFIDHNFATTNDSVVQFWDMRSGGQSSVRHLASQASRVLSLEWSPVTVGNFIVSTRDGSLRVWNTDNLEIPQTEANYKKVPMVHLRYTPQGTGIVSKPLQSRWTDCGLILWCANTLCPTRLLGGCDANEGLIATHASIPTTKESYVLDFGWCRGDLPFLSPADNYRHDDNYDTAVASSHFLTKSPRPANIISWSTDGQLRVQNISMPLLHNVELEQVEQQRRLQSTSDAVTSPPPPLATSYSVLVDDVKSVDFGRSPPKVMYHPTLPPADDNSFKPKESIPSSSRVVAQELSLLSSSMGQYKVQQTDLSGPDCLVKLALYYCRQKHYHHHTLCGFGCNQYPGAPNDMGNWSKGRQRSDSFPLNDLDALFQSTTMECNDDNDNSGLLLPLSGSIALVAQFPPTYPAPHSAPQFSIETSSPPISEYLLDKLVKKIQRVGDEAVTASQGGCLEPCLRCAFKHLGAPQSILTNDDIVVTNRRLKDEERAGVHSSTSIPGIDSRVPFPRTSGVCFSPSGSMITFSLHQTLVDVFSFHISGFSHTPRSLDDYRHLTEGREHIFQQVASMKGMTVESEDVAEVLSRRHLIRSRSAEAVVASELGVSILISAATASDDHPGPSLKLSSASLKSIDSSIFPKLSATASGLPTRRITFAVGSNQIMSASQQRSSRMVQHTTNRCTHRASPINPPTLRPHTKTQKKEPSSDRNIAFGLPKVVIFDVTPLFPMTKKLAKTYSMDILNPSDMCKTNIKVAIKSGRTDLIQFWQLCTTLAEGDLRQAPLPDILPPYAIQSVGRPLINFWMSHFLAIGDVQSLVMLTFVMAAIDSRSTPPGLLVTQSTSPAIPKATPRVPPPAPPPVCQANTERLQHPNHSRFPRNLNYTSPAHSVFFTQRASTETSGGMIAEPPSFGRSRSTVVPANPALLLFDVPRQHQRSVDAPLERVDRFLNKHHIAQPSIALSTQPPLRHKGDSSSNGTIITAATLLVPARKEPSYHGERVRSNSCSVDPQFTMSNASKTYQTRQLDSSTVSPLNSKTCTSTNPVEPCFNGQLLMPLMAVDGGNDEAFTDQTWLFPFKYVLQFSHFMNVYANLLSAWGLILARTRLSIEWHRVIAWFRDRSEDTHPNISATTSDSVRKVLVFTPSDWREGCHGQPDFCYHQRPIDNLMQTLAWPLSSTVCKVVPPISLLYKDNSNSKEHHGVVATALSHVTPSLTVCSVCNVTSRGVIMICRVCNHGGHIEHLMAWWSRLQNKKPNQPSLVCAEPDCPCVCLDADKTLLPIAQPATTGS